MSTYIAVPDPITPQWLTAVLHRSGVLRQGEVQAVEQQMTGAFNSHTSRLILHYSADTPRDLPAHLILKQNIQAAWGREAGAEEAKFYNLVASLPEYPAGIVPCYSAAYDPQSQNSYLLLQDLSATHQPPVTRDQQISFVEGVPPDHYIEAVTDTLAQIHAYWWDHALLGTDRFDIGYWSRNRERFELYLARLCNSWDQLIAAEQAWFPDNLRALYEHLFVDLPRHWEQYLEPRFRTQTNLTLIHGDAYFANFLCPKPGEDGGTYLLDWQSPTVDLGGYDLVNLCATFWTPEQRHANRREETILRRYHSVLQQHGVQNYAWNDLITDYQTGLIFWLLMPVQDGADGSAKDYWWPKMQCLVAAFRDWHCEDLLRA
ncbi:MAG: phosphotransferase [Herpetosiphonaceae bacterium]|nr:phosphotransferase [Herpetosiphonaceae bacterium]